MDDARLKFEHYGAKEITPATLLREVMTSLAANQSERELLQDNKLAECATEQLKRLRESQTRGLPGVLPFSLGIFSLVSHVLFLANTKQFHVFVSVCSVLSGLSLIFVGLFQCNYEFRLQGCRIRLLTLVSVWYCGETGGGKALSSSLPETEQAKAMRALLIEMHQRTLHSNWPQRWGKLS